jgi:hypothetical protein
MKVEAGYKPLHTIETLKKIKPMLLARVLFMLLILYQCMFATSLRI